MPLPPTVRKHLTQRARASLAAYARGDADYLADALPQLALELPTRTVFDALHRRLGPVLAQALDPAASVPSPVADERDGTWLKRGHCVGVNLRTTEGLLGALKYVLTLPPHVDSVHLLPVFEPGVVGSLYGMASWRINAEFLSGEWARLVPQLDNVEAQLAAFVDLCHAFGKTVGLDVIPHTDRFSEITLANPWAFEWVRRDASRLISHHAQLHLDVQDAIAAWAWGREDAGAGIEFFSQPEGERLRQLFGEGDAATRNAERDQLVQVLYDLGYETLPATMAPPYRGLELDPDADAVTIDEAGRRWREYRFIEPQAMSRVFGPLARYKVWGRHDDNRDWGIDFDAPRLEVFDYVAEHYRAAVVRFGFDFMRGDMSHVQMRPAGVPDQPREPYDLLRYVKRACARDRPYFGYFAESFLTADDFMTYGSESAHLAASEADVALGNLQSHPPHYPEWHSALAEYQSIAANEPFAPCNCYFSGDKDDPRFDRNFDRNLLARYFFAVLCPALPAYTAAGWRVRDEHPVPAPNEHYSKLYVFHYEHGPKATSGPFRWGGNVAQWEAMRAIDAFRQNGHDTDGTFAWKLPPDPTGARQHIAWTVGANVYVVNFGSAAVKVGAVKGRGRAVGLVTEQGAYDSPTDLLAGYAGVAFVRSSRGRPSN